MLKMKERESLLQVRSEVHKQVIAIANPEVKRGLKIALEIIAKQLEKMEENPS